MEGIANPAYVGDAPRDTQDEKSDTNVTKIKLENSSEQNDKSKYQLWKVIAPLALILCGTIVALIYFAVMCTQMGAGKNNFSNISFVSVSIKHIFCIVLY